MEFIIYRNNCQQNPSYCIDITSAMIINIKYRMQLSVCFFYCNNWIPQVNIEWCELK